MTLDDTFLPQETVTPDFGPGHIQVAGFQSASYVAGPGRRCVIWVSGCNRRCPGCFQPHYFGFDRGDLVAVNDLAERILELDDLDGVTFSGGEPFEQSRALSKVCKIVKEQKADLSIMAYSGYRIEVLNTSARFRELLNYLDVLIDGEYREELAGPYLWRGSSNQRVIQRDGMDEEWAVESHLTIESTKDVQISLTDSELLVTGFPDQDFQQKFIGQLESRGINLKRKS